MSELAGDHVSTYSTCIVMFLSVHKLMFVNPDCASVCVHVPKGALLSLCVCICLFLLIKSSSYCLFVYVSDVCLSVCTRVLRMLLLLLSAHVHIYKMRLLLG